MRQIGAALVAMVLGGSACLNSNTTQSGDLPVSVPPSPSPSSPTGSPSAFQGRVSLSASPLAVDLYACGISTGGALKCWGDNSTGELGDGTLVNRLDPEVIDPGVSYIEISTAFATEAPTTGNSLGYGATTCGITTQGVLKCWGANSLGQLGDGTTTDQPSPEVIDPGVAYAQISVGDSSVVCGITTDGALKCWGDGKAGQLGDGTTANHSTPEVVDPGVSYSRVAANGFVSCAITSSGILKCWGNGTNELGNGTTSIQTTPIEIDPGVAYSEVAVSFAGRCGITKAGALKCWGSGAGGALGTGNTSSVATPVVIDSGVTYARISVGTGATCGITTSGILKCWGPNASGATGNGATTAQLVPEEIDAGVSYALVSAGAFDACGITSAGALRCWGGNLEGELGDGTTTALPTPETVQSGTVY